MSEDFGRTWWGSAWIQALEQRASLDPNRLPRGRDYARGGTVGELTLSPGEVRAQVQGRMTDPYQVRVRVRRFSDDEWDKVLNAISARLGHAAALLDGELPPEIAQDAAGTGLDLLPGGGEIGPRCSCPDEADPCKHSAAACYLVADALDADPFVLLLLRGRTRDEVLAGVRARRRGEPIQEFREIVPDASADEGVDARAAFAALPSAAPVPAPPLPAARPGHPATLPVDPPPWRSGLREDLIELAADAASRAWELAVGLSTDGSLSLGEDADIARRAARVLGTPAFAALARHSGVPSRDLVRRALAWQHGGLTGLETLDTEWDPIAEDPAAADLIADARSVLAARTGAPDSAARNKVTAGRVQVRLGRDMRWYPYSDSGGEWEPAGPPDSDPAASIAHL
jgi:uncharacterized Zn finger protein